MNFDSEILILFVHLWPSLNNKDNEKLGGCTLVFSRADTRPKSKQIISLQARAQLFKTNNVVS